MTTTGEEPPPRSELPMPGTTPQDDYTLSLLLPPDDEATRLLTRSPHPYHRRSIHLQSSKEAPAGLSPHTSEHSSGSSWSSEAEEEKKAAHGAKTGSRIPSRSMSESGTEADDEGYSFVKALPAPPIRPHKGLRDLRGTDFDGGRSESPLLTPSILDEESRRLSNRGGYFKGTRKASDASSPSDEEVRRERERFAKRRRAELLRRGFEVFLVGAIGALVVGGAEATRSLRIWSRELFAYGFVYSGLVLSYPLRLLFSPRDGPAPLKNRIRIPAAFDPAPLIYPAVIPVLVSLSLYPTLEKILLPNIVLSLAALPPRLIPVFGQGTGYSMEHWIISILPLIISDHTDVPSNLDAAKPYPLKVPADGLPSDVIACLFFLHQALLPPIQYLTTTSLLSTELHLLSASLINLLLFAESPQMIILSAIIWIGGLCLFIFCGQVLRWGVALARIPKWRFRRAGHIIKARQSFLAILNQSLKGKTNSPSRRRDEISDSDADEDDLLLQQDEDLGLKPVESAPSTMQDLAAATASMPLSAMSAVRDAIFQPKESDGFRSGGRQRSSTLPDMKTPRITTTKLGSRRKRTRSSYAQSFLALTPAQAALRKWLYAGYTYLAMALIILVPIREYIARAVLDGIEPFGWAIGYLFGNIRDIRFWIHDWNLTGWIALPDLPDPETVHIASMGRVDLYRRAVLGEATTRLLLTGYWLGILAIGLFIVLHLSSIAEVDTRRKVFHGMMVLMLLPTVFVDPCFVALALGLVLAVFLLLDLIRASQLPPLSKPIAAFLTPYVDGRDLRGPVVVSHIFLLIGCAIPLWLSLAGTARTGASPWRAWDATARDVSLVAGVVCVGMGDAAASLVGRRFGRRKWPWIGGKSLEGSAAFAAAVVLGLCVAKAWARAGGWVDSYGAGTGLSVGGLLRLVRVGDVGRAVVAGCAASAMEAVLTGGNDNVIVPVVLWLVVRAVGL